jgi:hypothetical protein
MTQVRCLTRFIRNGLQHLKDPKNEEAREAILRTKGVAFVNEWFFTDPALAWLLPYTWLSGLSALRELEKQRTWIQTSFFSVDSAGII